MPKLSEKTLEKRFQCEYCGETFRTRQGLSGHIQFKHHAVFGPKSEAQQIDMSFIRSKLKGITVWKATNQLPQPTTEAMLNLLMNWHHVRYFFSMLDIDLTKQDFKTYLLVGLGRLFS